MSEKKNEARFKILPLNGKEELLVAINTSTYQAVIDCGNFVLMDDVPNNPASDKLVSLWTSLNGPVIIIWEIDDDGVYRPETDINLMNNGVISIEKVVRDGTKRRTDVKICY